MPDSPTLRITVQPDPMGTVVCPLCQRRCSLGHFVTGHLRSHRHGHGGLQRADVEVAVTLTIPDPDPAPDPKEQ